MFSKVLIANRGEIAVRVARTCKRLGITTVAVYSDADAESLHVKECDEAVHIGASPVRDSYLNVEAILAAAKHTGAQAIHPGYGLLSEKGAFAQAVIDAGLVFIGPTPKAMDDLGDKLRARDLARRANVRVVPGSDGSVAGIEQARGEAERIGYPVLIKAAGGGGGIGMQIVRDEDEFEKALRSASGMGKQAFGDERVYLERYVDRPRHVEIQFLADTHGNIVALGERECSIQRRHQKLIEESPSPLLVNMSHGESIREAMNEAAVRIATEAGYTNAGTCEFILDPNGVFYFLEVNARLQVEHPVTEMVTRLDLVELQLRIAAGEPLPESALYAEPRGHAIEARVCAENPAKNFLPSPGPVDELRWPRISQGKVRIETAVSQGYKVSHYYDSMIAKVVTYGTTRHEAVLLLDRMLAETHIAPLTTNISFLRKVLNHESFRAGQYDTTFIETHGLNQASPA